MDPTAECQAAFRRRNRLMYSILRRAEEEGRALDRQHPSPLLARGGVAEVVHDLAAMDVRRAWTSPFEIQDTPAILVELRCRLSAILVQAWWSLPQII